MAHLVGACTRSTGLPLPFVGAVPWSGAAPRFRGHAPPSLHGAFKPYLRYNNGLAQGSALITKSDAHFMELGLSFEWSESVNLDELNDLFQLVGFPRRDPDKFAQALSNTHCTLWVRSIRTSRLAQQGQLVAFARATSDKALTATIWDVAVTPAWQRMGLGRALVERLVGALTSQGLSTIALYAEPGVVGMYEKLGFVCDPQGVQGLALQHGQAR